MDSLDKFRLRVTEFNVENLFVLLDHYQGQDLSRISEDQWQGFSSSTIANKPIDEVRNIAKIFSELNSDIYMLCEVGGRESLENFNRHFLGDRYRVHLIEGNSDRGIDLGYLVSKALPFKVDLISHKHRSIDFLYPHERQTKETGYSEKPTGSLCSHRFSRDVLELRLFVPDATLPCLVLMMVHLKSQLDRDRIDPLGRDRRKAELEKLVKIFIEITDEFKGTVPGCWLAEILMAMHKPRNMTPSLTAFTTKQNYATLSTSPVYRSLIGIPMFMSINGEVRR